LAFTLGRSNAELMSWFRRFMSAEEPEDKIIDPKANPESGIGPGGV
jgi:paired amphipathic helix protein Sin3a